MRKFILLMIVLLNSLTAVAQSSHPVGELVLRNINGRQFRLAEYKGKVVLLNFWATWCPPCRAEMYDLVHWQRKYRNQGLQVIGVTYPPNNIDEIRKFIRKLKVNYPIAIGTIETKGRFMEGETLPITVVLDRNLTIRETIEGILLPEEFEQKIKPLMKQSRRRRQHQNAVRQSVP